jgi:hypothetical protein
MEMVTLHLGPAPTEAELEKLTREPGHDGLWLARVALGRRRGGPDQRPASGKWLSASKPLKSKTVPLARTSEELGHD